MHTLIMCELITGIIKKTVTMLLIRTAVKILVSENIVFLSRNKTASGRCLFAQNVVKEMNMKAKLSKELNHKESLGEMPGQLDNIYIPRNVLMIYPEHMVRS